MSLLRNVVLLLAAGGVAGCSQSPYPSPRFIEDNTQPVLSAGVHWEQLARETVDKVFGCLEGLTYWDGDAGVHQPYCRQDVDQIRYAPIYVERADSAVPFAEAFYRDLQTEIVERGIPLALRPEGALTLDTRIQLVERRGRVPLHTWPGQGTAVTTAALAGVGLSEISSTALAVGLGVPIAIGAGMIYDASENAAAYGGAQVVVTTALRDGDRVVMSKTDTYFVQDADLAHYASAAPAADLLLAMKPGATPPPLRTFTVVEE